MKEGFCYPILYCPRSPLRMPSGSRWPRPLIGGWSELTRECHSSPTCRWQQCGWSSLTGEKLARQQEHAHKRWTAWSSNPQQPCLLLPALKSLHLCPPAHLAERKGPPEGRHSWGIACGKSVQVLQDKIRTGSTRGEPRWMDGRQARGECSAWPERPGQAGVSVWVERRSRKVTLQCMAAQQSASLAAAPTRNSQQ